MQNLREVISEKLDVRSPVGNANNASHCSPRNSQFLLEPSFVCEQLGLQGRVDLMSADMSLLVEQKSGRNYKIERQSHDAHGLQREDHYVQLLLYYGILRYNFQKSDRQVDTRLLYSRYPADQGLLTVNYYRTLLAEALKLRNQIVATDLLVARDGFGRILPLLKADTMYPENLRDAHYHRFVEPEAKAFEQTVKGLSPLERAYLERMMTFVYREQRAQKLGGAATLLHHSGGSCTANLWQMPLSEKLETGNIYVGMTIAKREKSDPDGGFDLITLTGTLNETSNFRRGDAVFLYRYKDAPDVRSSILYKGTLLELGEESLLVSLNDGQQNADVFTVGSDETWAVEHSSSDLSAGSQVQSLMRLMTAHPERRALLLGQREPRRDESRRLSRSYNPTYDDIVLRQKQARDYFLLVGPPGTGKTSMALRFIVEEELGQMGRKEGEGGMPDTAHPSTQTSHVLLTAYTNRAVDEICAMLSDAGLDYLRVGHEASCEPRFRDRLLANQPCTTVDSLRQTIESVRIVVATTSTLQANPYVLQLKRFSLCVVDEASQILEPAIIGLLASDAVERFVLIGDHKQLPAVVQQSEAEAKVSEKVLIDIGLTDCRRSLFERLIDWERRQGRTDFTATLRRQGRMHPDVALFPSHHFYQSERLSPVPLPHQQETGLGYGQPPRDTLDCLLQSRRVLFLPVEPEAMPASEQANEAEAQLVAQIVERIVGYYGERFDPTRTLGIIVPYRSQIAAIRRALAIFNSQFPIFNSQITIDTVERYQGSQRDVIIYSFTISRRYQLDFLTSNTFTDADGQPVDRKLNVALTRARRQMIMVGSPRVLCHDAVFAQLVSDFSV